jgi:uncharacterized protein (DUF736 family)
MARRRQTLENLPAAAPNVYAENRDYHSVKLDDSSFPAAIHASLVDADDGYSLVWFRSRGSR